MTERQAKAARGLYRAQQEFTAAFAEDANGTTRWLRMLTRIEDAGGKVSGQQWREIGRDCGYDTRGLGGFYVGAHASMRREADNSRVLTAAGTALLDQHGRVR
jgi:hypothetical protein